ncbi:hypothetical protein ILUMI_21959 [Ignelater luminosus]|uniref:Leucine-rich repeat-containing protein 59 n=1 Tax=Ignelater luminosus TaxID=2038154 RepID=A0A8K0CDL8_IGNLU|nr:hypothetical protein ILUMI_21959 [Ignelater luminosus]
MAPAPQKINLKDKVEDGEIDLSMSDLQDVPVKEIAAIKKAHSLDLSNNHISILPKNFSTLVHLIKLDLSKNQLKELPENFGDLVKLKHLDLYKNQLQHLPLSFSKLKALKWLDLKDNPLVPAIATVAGPCLESKQCQQCAKDIVNFYSQLQMKVDEERKVRETQRQKDLQINAQKLKQEKKSKKDKKEKNKKNKENGQFVSDPKSGGDSEENTNRNSRDAKKIKKQSKLSSIYGLIKFLFITMLTLGIVLFVLTAAKVKHVQMLESKVVDLWYNGLGHLPDEYQIYGITAGENIKHVHELTGKGVETLTNYLCELSKNKSIHIIYNEVTNVFKNVTQSATEFYLKVFGK